ncbi:hypothetical protein ZIOFF_028274 [Zingiber officinale]|uniref:Methylenetetrahydrofolate reductase n=1 Tax=Zingiber officinale TaxID=94328 RepID=A0A8J5L3F8_ZINOF|nr:hypothetical protein ZIOFF_028274 [Zingiber officinale]
MDPSSKKNYVMKFEVSKVLEELRLTMDQLIDLCILSGCDYCDSIKVLDFEFPIVMINFVGFHISRGEFIRRKNIFVCMETIMHLTCTNMPVEKIDHAMNTIKANGIQNVLALKGDPPHGQDKCSIFELSMEIILVSLLLEAHPDMIQGDEGATLEAYNSDLAYLKRKTLSVVLKLWKSFSHVKILELCEIFILWLQFMQYLHMENINGKHVIYGQIQ